MNCPFCNQTLTVGTTKCPKCHSNVSPLLQQQQPNPYSAPANPQIGQLPDQQGDATGGLIPYKNPKALIAYYTGIISGLPVIGIPFGIAAFVLGILCWGFWDYETAHATPPLKEQLMPGSGSVAAAFLRCSGYCW